VPREAGADRWEASHVSGVLWCRHVRRPSGPRCVGGPHRPPWAEHASTARPSVHRDPHGPRTPRDRTCPHYDEPRLPTPSGRHPGPFDRDRAVHRCAPRANCHDHPDHRNDHPAGPHANHPDHRNDHPAGPHANHPDHRNDHPAGPHANHPDHRNDHPFQTVRPGPRYPAGPAGLHRPSNHRFARRSAEIDHRKAEP